MVMGPGSTIKPPFGSRAKASIARSISAGSWTSVAIKLTPNDWAIASIARHIAT